MSHAIKRRSKGEIARIGVESIFSNENHRLYTASDIEIAREYNVSRLTIFNIRKELSIKSRGERIRDVLNNIDTSTMTLKELSVFLGIKYTNLYKVVKDMKLKTRPDVRPIERMLRYQRLKRQNNMLVKRAKVPMSKVSPLSCVIEQCI